MRIKKVEIFGFKSFMEKATLEFDKGITAVVGPNGCGKSNIVDAIRWALGEQSAKQLRGRLMEDVIFNGSEAHQPLGMAEVTLIFSNENGTAPARYAEFSEIEISRRMFRSGESQYFINKVPCRRRDIVELFLDTGIGAKAYSIIEQDQVSRIINARPEEKRMIIEEAAGINKYKTRKEAAERKIESAKQNLSRVGDILREVERQSRSLESQAKAAERYKSLKERIREIHIDLAMRRYWQLEGKRVRIASMLEELKREADRLSAIIERQEAALEGLKFQSLERDKSFSELQEKIYQTAADLQRQESTVEFGLKSLKRLEDAKARGLQALEALKGKRQALIDEAEKIDSELSQWRQRHKSEGKRLQELASRQKELSGIKKRILAKQDSLRTSLVEILTRLASLRNDRANMARRQELLARSIRKNLQDQNEAKSRLDQLRRDSEEAEETLVEQRAEMERLELRSKEGVRRRETMLEALRKIDERLNDLRGKLRKHISRLRSLQELNDAYEGLQKGVRNLMLASRSGRLQLQGPVRLLADIIDFPEEMEGVVEGALGDKLQSVVVRDLREAIKAIGYLKQHQLGKASFVPKDEAVAKDGKGMGGDKTGAQKFLPEGIEVEEGYEGVARQLFGNILVVDEIEEALSIWRQNGSGKMIVTRNGDTIAPDGLMRGGAGKTSEGLGWLKRKREIEVVKASIKRLHFEMETTALQKRELVNSLAELDAELDRLRESMRNAELELLEKANRLEWIAEEIKRCKRRQELLLLEKDELERESREVEEELERLSVKLMELEEEKSQKDQEAEGIRDELSRLEHELSLLAQETTESRVRMASMKERVEHLEGRQDQLSRRLDELEAEMERQCKELEEGKREYLQTSEAIDGARQRIVSLDERYRVLQEEADQAKKDFQTLSNKIHEGQERLHEIQKSKRDIEERFNEHRLQEREIISSLGHICEDLKENFGISPEQLPSSSESSLDEESRLRDELERLKGSLARLGEVNLRAIEEYEELSSRYQALKKQQEDLLEAIKNLQKTINRINRTSRKRFREAFQTIDEKFREVFPLLFGGGEGRLALLDEGDVLEAGVDIYAQPPGKRLQSIQLLSGGEKAMTAVALLFSILMVKPAPFCLLDEVDSPLDDANIERFNNLLKGMAKDRQFILITHNKRTMEVADTLYGITMEVPGVTKMISVRIASI